MAKRLPLIGVDLMGGDSSPLEFIKPLLELAEKNLSRFNLCILATSHFLKKFNALEKDFPKVYQNIVLEEISDVVTMDDHPLTAARHKKNSSMSIGMKKLKAKKLDAFISMGNTGALVANATLYLSPLQQDAKPCLMATLPTKLKSMVVLDVGANINCKTTHLIQYAKLGATFQKMQGIENPKVALLNIGEEKGKGRVEFQETYLELQKYAKSTGSDITFLGNIEGTQAFDGEIDVLVTDGFSGNIFLKTAEGIASLILDSLKNLDNEESASIKKKFQDDTYPGALLLGSNSIVIKCHGGSSAKNLLNAVLESCYLVEKEFITALQKELISLP